MSTPAAAEPVEIKGSAAAGGRAASVATILEDVLVQALAAARPDGRAQLSALNLQVAASVQPGEPLLARAWVERATRTLAFVSGEVLRESGARVAAGAGVFELNGIEDGDSDGR